MGTNFQGTDHHLFRFSNLVTDKQFAGLHAVVNCGKIGVLSINLFKLNPNQNQCFTMLNLKCRIQP